MDLGTRLRLWREWKGLNQSQLAEAAGVSRSAMCQYEGAGKYKLSPSQGTLAAIVDALGLSMEKFYGRTPKQKKAAA